MDRGAWRSTVRGVTKNWTRLSDSHTHTHTHKELETLSLQGTTVAFFGGLLRQDLFPGRLDDIFLAYHRILIVIVIIRILIK